jgi:hypothetical protein
MPEASTSQPHRLLPLEYEAGVPGNLEQGSPNRRPMRCAADLTASFGVVFFPRTPLIIPLRRTAETMPTYLGVADCGSGSLAKTEI